MNTFESRIDELSTLSKNWKTDKLFQAELKKLADELTADTALMLTTGCDGAEIAERIKALKVLIAAQETWLWTQRSSMLNAEIPRVQWMM
ncbi:MAG TPA: hypothetical protein PLP18_06890 [Smithellaceae bacterium]|nr:hypothetical protein [Smithellaceae bacterium]